MVSNAPVQLPPHSANMKSMWMSPQDLDASGNSPQCCTGLLH